MAINETSGAAGGAPKVASPAWISSVFFAGWVLLYAGQRVLLDAPTSSTLATAVGALFLLGSVVARFLPQFRGHGDHAAVARLLSGLQVLGLLAAGVYALTTPWGVSLLGFAEGEKLESLQTVAHVVWVSLLALSIVPLVFTEFALHPMRRAETVEGRRVRSAALSGAAIAMAAIYGSLFVYAAGRAETQADFSYFKTSEPGEATVKLVQKLSEPLEVTGFFPEVSEVRKEVNTYLSSLKDRSQNLNYTLVDRYLEPAKAQELQVTQDGTLVLKHGETKHSINIGADIEQARANLVKLDQEVNSRLNKLARDRKTVYLTVGHGELNDRPKGEQKAEGRTADLLRQILEQQNYRMRDLGLNQGLGQAVPDDADLVLVLGPVTPFAPEEIATLKRYAEGGGKLLMALDTDAVLESDQLPLGAAPATAQASAPPAAPTGAPSAELPAAEGTGAQAPEAAPQAPVAAGPHQWLKDLAAVAGANFEPVRLADEEKHIVRFHNASDNTLLATNRFSSHASVSTLSRNSTRASVVLFGAGHLLEADQGGYNTDVAIRSFASSFVDLNGNFTKDAGEAPKSLNLAVAVTRDVKPKAAKAAAPDEAAKTPEPAASADEHAGHGHDDGAKGENPKKDSEKRDAKKDAEKDATANQMRAFVVADADAFSDLVLSRVVSNRMLAFDAIRWLVGEESLAGEIESEEDVQIEQTKQLDLAWFYTTIFGLPALVLGVGLTVSGRSRRAGRKSIAQAKKGDK